MKRIVIVLTDGTTVEYDNVKDNWKDTKQKILTAAKGGGMVEVVNQGIGEILIPYHSIVFVRREEVKEVKL